MADVKKVAAPPPPPPPPPPPAKVEAPAPALAKAPDPDRNVRVAGNTTVKVWDSDTGKGLEILKMHDGGELIEVWVKTK